MMSRHVIITGSGRCGTTLLMKILTFIDIDTGYTKQEVLKVKEGLEYSIKKEDVSKPPYVLKNPRFMTIYPILFDRMLVEHIVIPIRDLQISSDSRRRKQRSGCACGSLFGVESCEPCVQETFLSVSLFQFLVKASSLNIPITFINFTKMIHDSNFLFAKLKTIFGKKLRVSQKGFESVFNELVKPGLVHDKNLKRHDWC